MERDGRGNRLVQIRLTLDFMRDSESFKNK
jgi:hypothetical protein